MELNARNVILGGGALLFLLIWIFALGILVGRGFLPGDQAVGELKDQIGKLQEVIRRDRVQQVEREEPPESPKLAFYEKLATKKDEALGKKAARAKNQPREKPKPAAPEPEKERKREPVTEKPESRQARAEAPETPKPSTETKPRPATAAVESGDDGIPPPVAERDGLLVKARFTVQVAAMETRSAAEEMIRRLKRNGHPAYYYDVTVKGRTYYRVRCGRFLSRTEAEAYARVLKQREGINGFVSELD